MKNSLYKESKSSLSSLIKQTIQVGAGLTVILLLTGRNPSPFVLGGTVVAGICFVAYSEEKRLTKSRNKGR